MNETLKLSSIETIFFIGIGGIGMSALARHFNKINKRVVGYDKVETPLTRKLVEEGIEVHYKDDPELIPDNTDLVIYTPAIPDDQQQMVYCKTSNWPLIKRSEALGLLTQEHKTIAVAGTHGKTTTSALMTHCLKYLGIDVSAFVGGIMKNYNSNYMTGESDWMVVEADEFDRSFLKLEPDIAILISVDPDHLDIYNSHDEMKSGFLEFLKKVKTGGQIIIHETVLEALDSEVIESLRERISVSVYSVNLDGFLSTTIRNNGNSFFAGIHNVENALAVSKVIESLTDSTEQLMDALISFQGIKRRFEKVYESDNYLYIDDYAHHPTEINSVIEALRKLANGKEILGIFQPHLFSRTRDFYEGFAQSLSGLDKVILLDIYPAREEPIPGINSNLIFDLIENENKWLMSKSQLVRYLETNLSPVILTIGAGDIDTEVLPIKELLENIDG